MNRREFLQRSSVLAGAAYLNVPAFAEALRTLGNPNLVIGIVSDIHIRGIESAETFKHTLEYFRSLKVDGVIIAGDMADWGLEPQLKVVADTWYSVFPNDEGLDGKHTERLFIYGNHDMEAYSWNSVINLVGSETAQEQGIGRHPGEVWKKYFGEDYSPIWFKTIKGYHFIGAHWHTDNIPGLEELMRQHASELETEKPFFYIQHPHLKNTCNGPWAWGQDDGTVTKLMSRYPNAVAFSGHSHSPLTDDRNLWQGTFTSIGTASLKYQYPMPARENTYQDDSKLRPVYQMPTLDSSMARQGMIMRVYDSAITLERREFVYDQQLDDNWLLPWPISLSEPLSFENRSQKAPIPQFEAGAIAIVTQAMGRDRNGTETDQVTVHFPNVLRKRTGVRAFDFEVQVEWEWLDCHFISATKRVFSPMSLFGEAQDEGEVTCVFALSELPKDRDYRFIVRPCNCYSGKGDPIYTDWIKGGKIPSSLTATLTLEKQFYKTNTDIAIAFKNAPVGTEAWVGIYQAGKTPGTSDKAYTYQYTDVKDGSVNVKVSAAGEYFAVLFKDGGYTECSERVPFFVLTKDYDPTTFGMTTDKVVYNTGNPIRVTLAGAPAMSKDWIGIYEDGIVPRDVKCPCYLYNSKTSGTVILNTSGNNNWTGALPTGVYFIGYFMADGYTEPFGRQYVVVGKPALLRGGKSEYTEADAITLSYSSLPTRFACQLCRQTEGETTWTPVKEVSGASGTIELGNLQLGTYKYALCIDGAPISQTLTLNVKEDGETANAAIPAALSAGALYDLSGRKLKKTTGHGIFIQDGKKTLK
ncbi:MAG: metallophosphoesterase [Bacteroidaceae bacterium]|nr:metallophosphoesterase [Bacteroidaceae bacterium]